MIESHVQTPIFVLVGTVANATVFLRSESHTFLPIFTSFENADVYRQGSERDYEIIRLSSTEDARQFIEHPPGQPFDVDPGTLRLMLNPVGPFGAAVFNRDSFLDHLL